MSAVLDSIREKYPQYADIPDSELAVRIGDKYPVYLEQPDFRAEYESAKTPVAQEQVASQPQASPDLGLPEMPEATISQWNPSMWERFRASGAGRWLFGPTQIEKEAIRSGIRVGRGNAPIGLTEIPITLLEMTSAPPPVKEAATKAIEIRDRLTQPLIDALPESLQTITKIGRGLSAGAVDFAVNVPIAPIPGATSGKPLAAALTAFGADYLIHQPEVYAQFKDAVKKGEYEKASSIATQNLLGGALLGLGGREAIRQIRTAPQTTLAAAETSAVIKQAEAQIERTPNASKEPTATEMGLRSEGRGMVEEAPLRQQGEVAKAQAETPQVGKGDGARLQELEAMNQQGMLVGKLKREYEALKSKSAEANRAAAEQLKSELEAKSAEPIKEPVQPEATPPAPVTQGGLPDAKMRLSAQRATTSPDIPKPVQEVVKTAPESFYTPQRMSSVTETVGQMTETQLGQVAPSSDIYTAAKLEQMSRMFNRGENKQGYDIFVELEKQGTRFGQLINQFKLLKSSRPETVVQVVNEGLKKAGKDPLKPEQSARALEAAKKSKTSDAELEVATDTWIKNPTPENAKTAEAALDKANVDAVELQKFVQKFQPRSTSSVLKAVLQGNLLTPISQVANVVGNMSFLPFRALDRTVASGLDVISNAVLKKPREITVQPIQGTIEAAKGALRGLAKTPEIALRGTGDVVKGETRAGLHPVRAWINQFAKNPEMPLTGGKLTLKDRLNLAIEGTFGIPAETMLRGLGIGDQPFREAARARVVATELRLNKVPREQWEFAQKFPELFLDAKTMERVNRESLAAIFQRESRTLNLLTNWLKGKGDFVDFVAATVAPYKLTPWNIIAEILSYNPLVAFTRSVYDSARGSSRDAKLNAGKFVVGSMLTATGWWLYQKGLLAPSLDERDEAQKARLLSGEVLPPNHINISGLRRAMAGGDGAYQPGDETADIFRGGGLAGSIFYMVANIGRELETQPEIGQGELWNTILRQSTLEQARFGLNQSFLSGVEGMLTAVKDGNADNYLRQWSSTVASIPLPNSMAALSRATREYKPDFKEDTFLKQMENMVRNRLGFAGFDDYLPLKRDLWGKPLRETPEGRNAIFYQFFDISRNKQVTDDPVSLELYRLWRKTANTEVIPSIPTRTVTQDRQTFVLNPEQYSRFSELVGTRRREIVDSVVVNDEFYKLSDEEKIALLKRAYDKGMQAGKAEFMSELTAPLTPKPKRSGF